MEEPLITTQLVPDIGVAITAVGPMAEIGIADMVTDTEAITEVIGVVHITPVDTIIDHTILIGIEGGLNHEAVSADLINIGSNWNQFLDLITSEVAITHAIVGTLIPLFMCAIMTRYFGKNQSWKEGFSIFPFAILGGLAFTIPYALTGIFLGPEFPSIIGALAGLPIVVLAAKTKFLTPKTTWDFAPAKEWPAEWMGKLHQREFFTFIVVVFQFQS